MNLREEIEIFLKETYQSGNCMPREHIAARRLLQMFEKRIDLLGDNEWFDSVHDANMFRKSLDKVKEMLK